jgi:hypothetical protein
MKQQHTIEPNMTELPLIYSTMPNKWTKWTPMKKNALQFEAIEKSVYNRGISLK